MDLAIAPYGLHIVQEGGWGALFYKNVRLESKCSHVDLGTTNNVLLLEAGILIVLIV